MWQRVALVAGLGFVAGFAIAMLVTGGMLARTKLADTNQNRALELPAAETTTTTESSGEAIKTTPPPTAGNSSATATPKPSPEVESTSPIADSDLGCGLAEIEKYNIEKWLKNTNRNIYGDPADTVYAGGTPLFNERTGHTTERCQYILDNHPTKPWNG